MLWLQVSTEGSTMDSPVDLERYRHLTLDELRSYWKVLFWFLKRLQAML